VYVTDAAEAMSGEAFSLSVTTSFVEPRAAPILFTR